MMKYPVASLAFGLSASASILPRNTCTFTLSTSGGQSGIVGQLSDGQNRVGGGHPIGTYSISNGKITDSHGRGCILTPPTTQLQCDEGTAPTSGFSISDGQVEYNGSPAFYACPATDTEYNIYTTPVSGQAKCVKIELTASGCDTSASSKPSSPIKPSETPAPTQQSPTAPVLPPSSFDNECQDETCTDHCPADLNGNYQYPHLIIPVSKSSPNKAYGTSYNGKITSDISSIFNFDVPSSYTGTCSLVFLFPEQANLETSSFTFAGDGNISITELNSVATQSTTYATQGNVASELGSGSVAPGQDVVISTFPCPAGKTVSYEMSSVSGTSLEYFQDYNPSPIGLYIRSC
ncbi:hypothetical protein N431DRAFT_518127 [Stipitochalara longipes BDJ]|nr:hypothetical protein N431DRAFT_518127 [Stipitochalara longipes BDJ]